MNLVIKGSLQAQLIFSFLGAIFIGGLSACFPLAITETPINTTTVYITPYFTPTPSQVDPPNSQIDETATPRPFPTVTPFIYTVIQGDTMLGIAMRYGISLEELMEANPEVNPRILSIGTELVIPMSEDSQAAIPTATPIAMTVNETVCYQSAEGGHWCFLSVENNQIEPVENVSARMSLVSQSGELLAEIEATTPLNVIYPGQSLPIIGYFPPPLPDEFTPQVDLLSGISLSIENRRYLEVSIDLEEEYKSPDNLQMTVSGNASMLVNQDPATLVWVVVVAYDEDGDVVGVRKWEAYFSEPDDLPEQAVILELPLQAGQNLPFEITVFSLGPPIKNVEVLVEARYQ